MMRLICKSRTYQLSLATNKWNADDKINYSHAIARRLPAEVLYDAVTRVTGGHLEYSRASRQGTRAAELPDSGVELPSGFLTTFGRPAQRKRLRVRANQRPSARARHGLGQRADDRRRHRRHVERNRQARDQAKQMTRKLINELFLRILNRPATPEEIDACRKRLQGSRRRSHQARRSSSAVANSNLRCSGRSSSAPERRPSPGAGRTLGLRERADSQARRSREAKGGDHRQARRRSEDVRRDFPGQDRRLGESPVRGRPLAAARGNGVERDERIEAGQGNGSLRHRDRAQSERRRHGRRRDRPHRYHGRPSRGLDRLEAPQQGTRPRSRRQLRADRARARRSSLRPTPRRPLS